MNLPLYFVHADLRDDCSGIPTTPDPMPLSEVGAHMVTWLTARMEYQGYISNARMERLQPPDIEWHVVPYEPEEEDAGEDEH